MKMHDFFSHRKPRKSALGILPLVDYMDYNNMCIWIIYSLSHVLTTSNHVPSCPWALSNLLEL